MSWVLNLSSSLAPTEMSSIGVFSPQELSPRNRNLLRNSVLLPAFPEEVQGSKLGSGEIFFSPEKGPSLGEVSGSFRVGLAVINAADWSSTLHFSKVLMLFSAALL